MREHRLPFFFNMEISKTLIDGLYRHCKILLEKGTYDCRDIKTANALRLARKEIKKLEKILRDDKDRIDKKL